MNQEGTKGTNLSHLTVLLRKQQNGDKNKMLKRKTSEVTSQTASCLNWMNFRNFEKFNDKAACMCMKGYL